VARHEKLNLRTPGERRLDEKFIAIFARDSSYEEKYVKVCDSVTDALEELHDWIPEAESAKTDGEDPVFSIYKVLEVPLDVQEEVSIKVEFKLPVSAGKKRVKAGKRGR